MTSISDASGPQLPSLIVSGQHLPSSPAPVTQLPSTVTESIKKNLAKFADAVYRGGIFFTGLLPFSSRGVVLNLILLPLLVPIRLIQSIGPNFSQKMREYMDRDWNKGIRDSYIDLEAPEARELRQRMIDENFRYAAYMYSGTVAGMRPEGKDGIVLDVTIDARLRNNAPAHLQALNSIKDRFTEELGFQVDRDGNFYHLETGSIFNVVYDQSRNEVVVCFMGLGGEEHLRRTDLRDQQKIGFESLKAAGADWFGGIPPSARQAIEIGRIVQEITRGTGMTPVMVGHSHGGGLAQCAAAANGLKGVVFNSRPMGSGVRRYIGQDKVAENARNITAFSGRGDWLSGTRIMNVLAVIFERFTGIIVPRTIGQGYHLPNIPGQGIKVNHVGFYEEFDMLRRL